MSSQIGNNSVHHCSGAGATMRSKARASLARKARALALAIGAWPGVGHGQVAEVDLVRASHPSGGATADLARRARLDGEQRPARWAAGRRAEELDRARRSRRCGRSPTSPAGRPAGARPAAGCRRRVGVDDLERRSARAARRLGLHGGVVDGLHGRQGIGSGPRDGVQGGTSIEPKCRPCTSGRRLAAAARRSRPRSGLRVAGVDARLEVARMRRASGMAQHLEVVAGVVAEGVARPRRSIAPSARATARATRGVARPSATSQAQMRVQVAARRRSRRVPARAR